MNNLNDNPNYCQDTRLDVNNIFGNIDEIVKINEYNSEYISPICESIFLNNLELLQHLLINKKYTIYFKEYLCSGVYQNKFNYHPNKCHDFICKKTAVYYGLWTNVLIYSKIFILLINLLDNSPLLHFRTSNYTEDTDIYMISEHLKYIYTEFIELHDSTEIITNYENYYTNESMYFDKIFNLFKIRLEEVLKLLISRYGSTTVENPIIFGKMVSWRRKLGKSYIYLGEKYITDNTEQIFKKCGNSKNII